MESDAGEIPQAAAEAKNDKRYEGRIAMIAVGIGRFTLATNQKGFLKRLRTCVGHTGGGQVKNTCCDPLLSLFCSNYLRHGLKSVICYVMLRNTFFDSQKSGGWPH